MAMKINKDMRIEDVLEIIPEAAEIFMGFGMHCFACPMGTMETIEEAVIVHGIDLKELLDKLNELANKKEN